MSFLETFTRRESGASNTWRSVMSYTDLLKISFENSGYPFYAKKARSGILYQYSID